MNEQIATSLALALNHQLAVPEIESLLEKPKHVTVGDVALPCFKLAKKLGKSPQTIAAEIKKNLKCDVIQSVDILGGYVNLFFNQSIITQQVLTKIVQEQQLYGTHVTNKGNVVFDFSSPNIAKPFSMGHLRSTVIGNALANIAEKNGYKAIRINHLGDWGTQFRMLINHLKEVYPNYLKELPPLSDLTAFYKEAKEKFDKDPDFNKKSQLTVVDLQQGDPDCRKAWETLCLQ